jgi:hypothetical protein
MSREAEGLRNRTIGGEEALGLARRLEPLHAPLPLTGGLMGVLGAVIEIPVLARGFVAQFQTSQTVLS